MSIEPSRIFLFQDGYRSKHGGDLTDPRWIERCVALFEAIFPGGQVLASDDNLGVARNFARAESRVFDQLTADAAFFFEDDLVLSPHYLNALHALTEIALKEKRIAYVAAYGDHKAILAAQMSAPTKLIPMHHKWAFALTRRQWLDQRELVQPYLDIVSRSDYPQRDHNAIREYFHKLGYGAPGTSQDAMKDVASCVLGTAKIMTYACFGKYIGATGAHSTQETYETEGFSETELYPDQINTFIAPHDTQLNTWIMNAQNFSRQSLNLPISETRPQHKSSVPTKGTAYEGLGMSDIQDFRPRMSVAETDLFTGLLATATNYLEYGAGGSTLAAINSNAQRVVSIETDNNWLETVRNHPQALSAIAANRLILKYVDVGPVAEWGVPRTDDRLRNWPSYAAAPFVETDFDFDTVLVDGRFRVHCLLALASCITQDARIFLHDYRFRHGYTIADKYFDVINEIDSSVLLRLRSNINKRSHYIDLISSLFEV